MSNIVTAAQFTNVFTTTNALGSFAGSPLPNLQMEDLQPGEYTLQFQVVEDVIDGLGSAAYAIVRWKVRGQQVQRIISIFSGAVLGGVAEAVDVQILDQSGRGIVVIAAASPTNGSPVVPLTVPVTFAADEQVIFASQPNVAYGLAAAVNNVPLLVLASPYTGPTIIGTTFYALARYMVAVTLSKGTRPTIMQPPVLQTTRIYTTVAPTATAVLPIPQDAGVISALVTVVVDGIPVLQAPAANGVVKFNNPAVLAGFPAAYIPNVFPAWFPVPPGATEILFQNHNPVGVGNTLDFSVQWGIEG